MNDKINHNLNETENRIDEKQNYDYGKLSNYLKPQELDFVKDVVPRIKKMLPWLKYIKNIEASE